MLRNAAKGAGGLTMVASCLTAWAAATLLAQPASAQEWTRFRGPNGTGVSAAAVPVEYKAEAANWNVEIPGVGHSSPVIWGKLVFVTSAMQDTGARSLHCVRTTDGKLLWSKTYPFKQYGLHRLNTSASATPAVDKDRVYTIWPSAEQVFITAHDHQGKELWRRDYPGFISQHGGASSPILHEGLVIWTNEQEAEAGFLTALEAKTGKTVWTVNRETNKSGAYATPMIYRPEGGAPEVIFSSTAVGITSLDPKTGQLNWEVRDIFKQRCVSSPVLSKGLIYQTSGSGAGDRKILAVRPGNKAKQVAPKVEFELPGRGMSYVPTPVAYGDYLFFWGDAGVVSCVKAGTNEVVWSERVGGNYYSSPICAGGKLYCVDNKGELVVVEAGPTFKLVARSPLGEGGNASPAVSDGVLYLRTESHLISLGGKK